MRSKQHYVLITIVAALVVGLGAAETDAQNVDQLTARLQDLKRKVAQQNLQVQAAKGRVAFPGFNNRRHTTKKPEEMELIQQMQIEQMQAICNLSVTQTKKLTLAGKAAARKCFTKAKAPLIANRGLGRILEDGKSMDVQKDSLSDEDSEMKEPETDVEADIRVTRSVSLHEVTRQSIWEKAVNSILSEEQQDQWQAFVVDQDRKLREALVDGRMTGLQYQLCLTPAQVPAIRELVERLESDVLVKDFNAGKFDKALMRFNGQELNEIKEEDLRDILTKAQLGVWKADIDPDGLVPQINNLIGLLPKVNDKKNGETKLGVMLKPSGLQVQSVQKKSIAESLGIQAGDIIDAVNGELVDSPLQLKTVFSKAKKPLSITVLRDDVEVRLEQK